jgi:hypothetical protein
MLYSEIIAVCSQIHTKHTNKYTVRAERRTWALGATPIPLKCAPTFFSGEYSGCGVKLTNFLHLLPWLKMSGVLLLLPLTCLNEIERDLAFLGAVRKIAKSECQLRHVSPVCPSAWKNSAITGRIFMKFVIWKYFDHLSRNFKFHWILTTITGTLHIDQYIFWSHLAQFFLEWEMFQTKVVQKIKTHILCSVNFPPENLAVYEIMWENNV